MRFLDRKASFPGLCYLPPAVTPFFASAAYRQGRTKSMARCWETYSKRIRRGIMMRTNVGRRGFYQQTFCFSLKIAASLMDTKTVVSQQSPPRDALKFRIDTYASFLAFNELALSFGFFVLAAAFFAARSRSLSL